MPSALTQTLGQRIPKRVSVLLLFELSHSASVLDLLSQSPEHSLNKSSFSNRLLADKVSATRQVVSSAYCDNLNSFESSDRTFIDLSLLIALARSSAPITKRIPERGHRYPCQTPRSRRKKEWQNHCQQQHFLDLHKRF